MTRPWFTRRLAMPQPENAALARFRAAEARIHRSASDLERVSLDAVDRSAADGEPPGLPRELRIARAVAEVTRRYREARHPPEVRHAR